MKSYTDIEQSRKLAKILSPESADCFWDYDDLQKYHSINWFEEGSIKKVNLGLMKTMSAPGVLQHCLMFYLGLILKRNFGPVINTITG